MGKAAQLGMDVVHKWENNRVICIQYVKIFSPQDVVIEEMYARIYFQNLTTRIELGLMYSYACRCLLAYTDHHNIMTCPAHHTEVS